MPSCQIGLGKHAEVCETTMAFVKRGKKLHLGFIQWDNNKEFFIILKFEWTFLQNLVNPLIVRVWTKLHKACDKGGQKTTSVKKSLPNCEIFLVIIENVLTCNTNGFRQKEFYSEPFKLGMKKCLSKFDNGSTLHTLFIVQHYEKSFPQQLEC
jgi:hypothetical protein